MYNKLLYLLTSKLKSESSELTCPEISFINDWADSGKPLTPTKFLHFVLKYSASS